MFRIKKVLSDEQEAIPPVRCVLESRTVFSRYAESIEVSSALYEVLRVKEQR
jgi:hypothetical protein